MNASPPAMFRRSAGSWLKFLPALAAPLVLYPIASRGLEDPAGLLALAAAATLALVLMLERAPLVLLWMVPASMCAFIPSPIQHYEAVVALLGLLTLLATLSQTDLRHARLEPIEWLYGLFLATSLPALVLGINWWRYFSTLKVLVIGFIGFEVARRGAKLFGRRAMLWGPALFMLITAGMLGFRVLQLGLPGFKSILLRTYITHLPWGTSNFVAAVQVLCMPAIALLIRLSPPQSFQRVFAVFILIATLLSMIFTSSRGGFVLSVIYLLTLGVRMRPPTRLTLLITGAFVLVLVATPFGQGLLARFTNRQSLDSLIYRVRIWDAAWDRGATHLPFGVGAGQGVLQQDRLAIMDPHDFLLTLFSEMGPAAVLMWLWVMGTLWQLSERLRGGLERQAGRAMRATIVLAFFNSLFEPTLTSNLYYLLFWWIVGIFESLRSAASSSPAGAAEVPGAA